MRPFELLQSPRFERDFKKFNENTQKRINSIILEEILTNPYNFTLMKYEYAGIREIRLERNLRVLFAICDECRELRSKLKRCVDCDENENNTIKLLTSFYHKKKRYPKIF